MDGLLHTCAHKNQLFLEMSCVPIYVPAIEKHFLYLWGVMLCFDLCIYCGKEQMNLRFCLIPYLSTLLSSGENG